MESKDFVRGLIVTVLSAVLSSLLTVLNENGLSFTAFEVQMVITTALTTGISYLLKNLATDDHGKLGGKWKIK